MAVWRAYRLKRGSLNIGRRVEQAVGNALAIYANSNRKQGTNPLSPFYFMPHEDKPKAIEIDAEEYLMSMVGK